MMQPIHQTNASGRRSTMRKTALLFMTLVMTAVSAQSKPTTGHAPVNGNNKHSARQEPTAGYAPVNGINMYYEVHGSGEPVVLLHGAFMTITNNWAGWIS